MCKIAKNDFVGIAAVVLSVLDTMYAIHSVTCQNVRSVRGQSKVKIPVSPSEKGVLPITVFDTEHGKRDFVIRADNAGAVARILSKRLRAHGVSVVTQ